MAVRVSVSTSMNLKADKIVYAMRYALNAGQHNRRSKDHSPHREGPGRARRDRPREGELRAATTLDKKLLRRTGRRASTDIWLYLDG
jgi:hypothetical protein